MSNRAPSPFWIRVTGTGAGGSSDPSVFTLAASGTSAVPGSVGAHLHLAGVEFEAAANGLSFICTRSVQPTAAASSITATVDAPSFREIQPGAIDHATTAFPFVLHYGPLGAGGL